ncbi:MAG: carboxypeptidase regulatory-like domain-containing protein [Myxococcota bacterium]
MNARTLLLGTAMVGAVGLVAIVLWRVASVPGAADGPIPLVYLEEGEPPRRAGGLVAFADPVSARDGITRGRVIDAVAGGPIPGAVVETDQGHVLTDDQGAFTIPYPTPLSVRAVRADGYGSFDGRGRSQVEVRRPVEALVLRLSRATPSTSPTTAADRVYAGSLKNYDGQPVADATVEVEPADEPGRILGTTRSKSEGRFEVRAPGASAHRLIAIDGHSVAAMPAQSKAAMRFGRRSSLRVQLDGHDPSRLSYLSLTWIGMRSWRVLSERVIIGDAGEVLFADAGPGRFQVDVMQSDGASASAQTDLQADETVRLKLQRGALLTGRVVEDSGAPVAGATVQLVRMPTYPPLALAPPPLAASTGPNGAFSLRGVPKGTWRFLIRAPGFDNFVTERLGSSGAGEMVPLMIEVTRRRDDAGDGVDEAGIGVEFRSRVYELLVVQVLAGSGAQDAGLRSGDRVLAVEGQPISEIGYERTLSRLSGAPGTTIELEVRPAGAQDSQLIRVERRAGLADRIR